MFLFRLRFDVLTRKQADGHLHLQSNDAPLVPRRKVRLEEDEQERATKWMRKRSRKVANRYQDGRKRERSKIVKRKRKREKKSWIREDESLLLLWTFGAVFSVPAAYGERIVNRYSTIQYSIYHE